MLALLILLVLANSSPPLGDDSIAIVDTGPLVLGDGLRILAAPSQIDWADQDTWLAEIFALLGNNSSNGLNYTPVIA